MKLHVIGKQQMQHQKTGLWYDGYICTDGINTQIIPEQKLMEYAKDHRIANARVVSFRGRKVLQITSKLDNKLPIQTEVIHTVKTKSKEYIICGPVDRLPNGNKCLTVNIIKGLELEKSAIFNLKTQRV